MEEEQEKPAYYSIITADVRYDKTITPNAKLLYGDIVSLCNEQGFVWLNNRQLSLRCDASPQLITKWIKILADKSYININKNENIVNELKAKHLFGLGFGSNTCDWCCIKTSVLHKHHYPIPRADGGREVVNICPNCHHEFHHNYIKISLVLSKKKIEEINKEKKILKTKKDILL